MAVSGRKVVGWERDVLHGRVDILKQQLSARSRQKQQQMQPLPQQQQQHQQPQQQLKQAGRPTPTPTNPTNPEGVWLLLASTWAWVGVA